MEPKTVGRLHQRPALALQAKISGFVVGTDIVTGDGLLPVEHVGAGDRIVTRDAGMQRVAWAEAAYVTTHAVKISPDALGRGRPEDAVIVPAGQKLLVRDWRARALYGAAIAYVPAYRLADGEHIKKMGVRTLRLIRLGFDDDRTLYVGGMEMMSHPRPLKVRRAG